MIGSGIFLLPAVLAPYGSFSVLGWLVSGAGTFFVALTLGAMARRVPHIGGPYAYTRAAFGDLPGFLIAWGYWISVWSGSAAMAVACAGYLSVFLPGLSQPAAAAAAALATLWILTGVNLAGVRSAGIFQLTTTLLKIVPLLAIGLAGIWAGEVTGIPAANPDDQPWPLLVASVAMLTMWAYVGMEAGAIPAQDIQNPRRTIPRALLTGTAAATAVYILSTVGVMAMLPADQLARSASPFADAALKFFGAPGAQLVGLGAIISISGTLNANILLAGQMPRAAALDGLFPAVFRSLNKQGSPAASLLISAGLSSALIVMNYSKGLVAAFTTLILLSTLTTLIPYAVSAAADLVMQRRESGSLGRARPVAFLVALLALLFSVFAILGSGMEVVAYGSLLLLAGLPAYVVLARRSRLRH